MLTINQLYKSYGNVRALNGISFQLVPGEIFGLIGRNGAGKTTTMRILSGLIPANSGSALYNNVDLLHNHKLLKQQIGFMPDFFGIYHNRNTLEIVIFFIKIRIEMSFKNVNKIAWWIPVKKWRESFKRAFDV